MINNQLIIPLGGAELTIKQVAVLFFSRTAFTITYTGLTNGELAPSYREVTSGSSAFVSAVVGTTVTLICATSEVPSYVGLTLITTIHQGDYTVHILQPTV